MLEIVIQVEAPPYMAQGLKEDLAMTAQEWGPTRVASVRELSGAYRRTVISTTGGTNNGSV